MTDHTPSTPKRSPLWQLGFIVLLLAAVAGGAYYFGTRDEKPKSDTEQTVTPTPQATPSQSTPIKVYFSKNPESNDDPTFVVEASRTCPDMGVGRCAITELLKGPTVDEQTRGLFTPLKISGPSTCNGPDFTLTITNGLAKLQFCRRIELTGVLADARIQNTIEKSLKQFSTVSKVAILDQAGNCALDLTGENRCLQP